MFKLYLVLEISLFFTPRKAYVYIICTVQYKIGPPIYFSPNVSFRKGVITLWFLLVLNIGPDIGFNIREPWLTIKTILISPQKSLNTLSYSLG